MSQQDIASSGQNFFQGITSPAEIDRLFQGFVATRALLQVKPANSRDVNENSLSILKGYNCIKTIMLAKFVSGPSIAQGTDVTLVTHFQSDKYFCTGRVVEFKDTDYVLSFEKIFKLQRRNNFRVVMIDQIIQGEFHLLKVDTESVKATFKLLDLSAGGFAVEAFSPGSDHLVSSRIASGTLHVDNHSELLVKASIKYKRRENIPGGPTFFHTGFEFTGMPAALTQSIGAIVNDCHRQIFSRLKK